MKSVIMVATENNTFLNDQFERFRYTKLLCIIAWSKDLSTTANKLIIE